MPSYLTPEYGLWFELVLVLAVGTAAIVGLATFLGRFIGSVIWQRTIWQVTTLGLLALVLVELTGTGPALVRLWQAKMEAATTQPRADPTWVEGQPSTATVDLFATADQGLLEEQEFPPTAGGSAAADRTARGSVEDELPRQATVLDAKPASPSPSVFQEGATSVNPFAFQTRFRAAAASPMESDYVWWLGVVWALGAAVIAGRMVCARVLLFAFRRRRVLVSDQTLFRCVGTLARRLGIWQTVCVVEGVGLTAPVAFGNVRPTIALPARFADDFDRRQQEAMLAHELAHLAARDPLWQVLADSLCAVLWWHPLAWWSRCRLRTSSEAAADEASLLVPDGPDVLADCLVAIGRRLVRPRLPIRRDIWMPHRWVGWLSIEGSGFRSNLGRRVERLLNLRARPWRAPPRRRLVLAKTALPVALVIVAVSCTAWARPQAPLTEGGTAMNVLKTSWRRSLAATVLLTLLGPASGDAVADDPPAGDPTQAVPEEGEREPQEGEVRKEQEQREVRKEQERQQMQRLLQMLEREERTLLDKAERERDTKSRAREIADCMSCHEGFDELGEIHGRISKIGDLPCLFHAEQGQLGIRLEELSREVDRLREAGKREEAENLEQVMDDLEQLRKDRLVQVQEEARKLLENEAVKIRELLGEIQKRKLEVLDREAQLTTELLKRHPMSLVKPHPPSPLPPGLREELQRGLEEFTAFVEKLHAARCPQPAESLRREAERLVKRLAEEFPDHRPRVPLLSDVPALGKLFEHREGPLPPEVPSPGGPPDVERVIQELRTEVKELRREMDEIRRLVKDLRPLTGERR